MTIAKILMAGAALALLAGSAGTAMAQEQPVKKTSPHQIRDGVDDVTAYRPLTVGGHVVAAATDTAGAVVGGTVAAATTIAAAPVMAVAPVIAPPPAPAPMPAPVVAAAPPLTVQAAPRGRRGSPPLPIKARYARTGNVANTFEEGYDEPVPVDGAGPIYMLDKDAPAVKVTPFSLVINGISAPVARPGA